MSKKLILIDLDGVLNQYNGNYIENIIPPIKPGAKKFLSELNKEYEIKIFTTRNKLYTVKWLIQNNIDIYIKDVTNIKEPAWLYIDDRCITFNGNYKKLEKDIKKYNVWYKK